MEKKIYEKPALQVEEFIPNRYVAACPAGPGVWEAECRSRTEGSCLIFFGGGASGPDDWTVDANRGGCGQTHQFTLTPGETIGANCWLLTSVTITNTGTPWSPHYEVSPSSAAQYFTGTIQYDNTSHGHGITLTQEGIDHFMGTGELVQGYYNEHVLGSSRWLVTDDLLHIHPTS